MIYYFILIKFIFNLIFYFFIIKKKLFRKQENLQFSNKNYLIKLF